MRCCQEYGIQSWSDKKEYARGKEVMGENLTKKSSVNYWGKEKGLMIRGVKPVNLKVTGEKVKRKRQKYITMQNELGILKTNHGGKRKIYQREEKIPLSR